MDHDLFRLLEPIAILGTIGTVVVTILGVVGHFRQKARELVVMSALRAQELNNERLGQEARLKDLELTVSQFASQSPLLSGPPTEAPPGEPSQSRKERA